MHNRTRYYLFATLLLVGGACRRGAPEQEIAREFCECFQEMTDRYRQVQEHEGNEANDAFLALMEGLEKAAKASEECVENMELTHGGLLDEKEEEIKAEMKKRCPNVIETLEEIDAGYE